MSLKISKILLKTKIRNLSLFKRNSLIIKFILLDDCSKVRPSNVNDGCHDPKTNYELIVGAAMAEALTALGFPVTVSLLAHDEFRELVNRLQSLFLSAHLGHADALRAILKLEKEVVPDYSILSRNWHQFDVLYIAQLSCLGVLPPENLGEFDG